MMKKLLPVFLFALLLAVALPSLAADSIKIEQQNEFYFPSPIGEADAFTLLNQTPFPLNVRIDVYDEAAKLNAQTIHLTLNPGAEPMAVKARVYKPLQKVGSINTYRYTVTADDGFKAQLYCAQKLVEYDIYNQPVYQQLRNVRYRNNTATAFGPHFRDTTPELTKLWYMYTPLDLTRQGRQTYELVGSNMYVIGEVYVDVYGDTVTVTYHNFYDGKGGTTKTTKEYLGIFGSYSDVVLPSDTPLKSYVNPDSRFQFGVPFSIQYDLKGDTRVLMLVRNVVDYWLFPRPNDAQLRRFYENSSENSALRSSMMAIMDPIQ